LISTINYVVYPIIRPLAYTVPTYFSIATYSASIIYNDILYYQIEYNADSYPYNQTFCTLTSVSSNLFTPVIDTTKLGPCFVKVEHPWSVID